MNAAAQRRIVDKDFAKRLNTACDKNAGKVPPYNRGRLTTIQQLLTDCSVSVSLETVRKWFAGEARPRPDKMKLLADILQVDIGWLSHGEENLDKKERAIRNKYAQGAVNILAGHLQLAGGVLAFPESESAKDFTVIIDHKCFDIHAALAQVVQGSSKAYELNIPSDVTGIKVIGVIPISDVDVIFLNIDDDILRVHGTQRGGRIQLLISQTGSQYRSGSDLIPRISNFSSDL